MTQTFDCIVLGVGGFGSGALYHLARRGVNVVGLEQFGVAHDRGSSSGETRIVRKAYFEHPDYVPLLLRAYELWTDLRAETSRELWDLCGLMLAGPAEGEAISGAHLATRLHHIPLEDVPLEQARTRFSAFRIPDDFSVVFEPEAGYLRVEQCVRSHIERAQALGAQLCTNEPVQAWETDGKTVKVRTEKEVYEAPRMVVTAGAWTSQILAELDIPLTVLRKLVYWFEVNKGEEKTAAGLPAFYFELPDGAFYGFPSIDGQTMKVAEHTGGFEAKNPSVLDRESRAADSRPVEQFVSAALPILKPKFQRHAACMYTISPDHHFIVDRHPAHENVIVGAGFSGHGFKFTSVLGEAFADLAIEGSTRLPIGFLSANRFQKES